jgi:hypothetical protein
LLFAVFSLVLPNNQSTPVTDGMAVMSLSVSLQHTMSGHGWFMAYCVKLKIIIFSLCQIMLNNKLLGKFDKWYKLSSRVKAKSHKKQSHETRPACNVKLNKFLQLRHKNYISGCKYYFFPHLSHRQAKSFREVYINAF